MTDFLVISPAVACVIAFVLFGCWCANENRKDEKCRASERRHARVIANIELLERDLGL